MHKLATLIVALAAVALLAAACGGGDGNGTAPTRTPEAAPTSTGTGRGPTFSEGLLAINNRSNLSVCVDGAAGNIVTDAAVEKVRQAVDGGLASVSANYVNAARYRQGAIVSTGCPPPTAALTVKELAERPHTQRHGDLLGEPARILSFDSLSLHRVFVYFIPEAAYDLAFGSEPYAKGVAEYLCYGHNCAEVTTGLYVTPSVPLAVLREGILDAIGFLPSASVGDPPRDPAESERLRQEALELQP